MKAKSEIIDIALPPNVRQRLDSSPTISNSIIGSKPIEGEIAHKVVEIIINILGIDECEATYNASFTNDLGADSLDAVELIMRFEKEFGVTISDEMAEKIQTVGDAIKYIKYNSK